jgi:hypothetical protein
MLGCRRPALVRVVTLALLIWAVLDLGAHGLFASDFEPLAPPGLEAGTSNIEGGSAAHGPHHCFCHSLSLGATLPAPVVRPEQTAVLVPSAACGSPQLVSRPLFHPPPPLA